MTRYKEDVLDDLENDRSNVIDVDTEEYKELKRAFDGEKIFHAYVGTETKLYEKNIRRRGPDGEVMFGAEAAPQVVINELNNGLYLYRYENGDLRALELSSELVTHPPEDFILESSDKNKDTSIGGEVTVRVDEKGIM